MFRTQNPTLNENTFRRVMEQAAPNEAPMTLAGFYGKTAVLFGLLLAAGAVGWTMVHPIALIGCLASAFVLALVVSFRPRTAPALAPLYAVLQGYVVGAISTLFAREYDGIVPQAIVLTMAVFGAMLGLWATNVIRVTTTYVMVVAGATIGIMIAYLVTLVGSIWFPGLMQLPMYQPTPIGIAFSLFVVVIAALNLAIDFETVRQGVEGRAPKHMEWYAGFGLLVTVVWLYIEMLRLLAKLRR